MAKKKVLLLNPPATSGEMVLKDQYCSNTSKARYYWIPIDLLILSGDLADKFDVKVIDSIVENLSLNETTEMIKDYHPDHIVILSSLLTHHEDRELVRSLRTFFSFKTTFIGDVFYFNPKMMIEFDEVDSIIYEYPCPQLASFIEEGSAKNNIIYKEVGEVIKTPIFTKVEIDYKTPRHDLFPIEKYTVPFMMSDICTSILTNFGCKFTCNYCPASSVAYRERSLDDILTEIKVLKDKGIDNYWIRDFTFGLNKESTIEFLKAIENMNLNWFCLTRAEILNEKFIKLMANAGCYLVMLGVDTSSKKTMKKVSRMQDMNALKRKISMLKSANIFTLSHMILGLPEDGIRDMLRTIHFLCFSKATFLSINFFSPRAGSAFFDSININDMETKKLDSNYSDNYESQHRKFTLQILKIYGLLIFYFNPIRILLILSGLRSKKQFFIMVKTGFHMFFPKIASLSFKKG